LNSPPFTIAGRCPAPGTGEGLDWDWDWAGIRGDEDRDSARRAGGASAGAVPVVAGGRARDTVEDSMGVATEAESAGEDGTAAAAVPSPSPNSAWGDEPPSPSPSEWVVAVWAGEFEFQLAASA
jgi:hypothetical protein